MNITQITHICAYFHCNIRRKHARVSIYYAIFYIEELHTWHTFSPQPDFLVIAICVKPPHGTPILQSSVIAGKTSSEKVVVCAKAAGVCVPLLLRFVFIFQPTK